MALAKIAGAIDLRSRAPRALDTLSLAFAAFLTGARWVPMGDNGALLRELAARAGRGRLPAE
jgi:hypothetical protein